jgi:outer membrane protein OmpA-like peptidoglycan-associated protein
MNGWMSPAILRKRKQLRMQALTYLVAGLATIGFMTLYLAPRAAAQRSNLAAQVAALKTAPSPVVAPIVVAPGEPVVSPETASPIGASAPATAAAAASPVATEPLAPNTRPAVEPALAPTAAAASVDPAVPTPIVVSRFATGGAALSRAHLVQIQRAAKQLLADATLQVTVNGHADRRGSELENHPLSEQRAAAVADALRSMGVEADRIEVRGAGSQAPLAAADTLAAFAHNRRVEIEFTRRDPR